MPALPGGSARDGVLVAGDREVGCGSDVVPAPVSAVYTVVAVVRDRVRSRGPILGRLLLFAFEVREHGGLDSGEAVAGPVPGPA